MVLFTNLTTYHLIKHAAHLVAPTGHSPHSLLLTCLENEDQSEHVLPQGLSSLHNPDKGGSAARHSIIRSFCSELVQAHGTGGSWVVSTCGQAPGPSLTRLDPLLLSPSTAHLKQNIHAGRLSAMYR